MKEDEVITINIPAGVSEGMQLSMSGAGNAARHGGINGDLLILVQEEPHPELLRDENDLIYNALIDFPTAALGGTLEVPTIDGKAKVKIEPGRNRGKFCGCEVKVCRRSIVMVWEICWLIFRYMFLKVSRPRNVRRLKNCERPASHPASL